MLSQFRRTSFAGLKKAGIFRLVRNSQWRNRRLQILCYHGISMQDEHRWRPALFMPPHLLEERFKVLKRGNYNVLPLGDALRRLYANDLPPRSVVLTFDDGGYDFFKQAYPLLKSFGFPVTVYQTTYYSNYPRPIFNLICSYMLWKHGGLLPDKARELGIDVPMDLRTDASRRLVLDALISKSEKEYLTGQQKDELARRFAKLLGIDYDELVAKRMLQVMNPQEMKELAAQGVDFQLHTHRHRTPDDAALFQKEIRDNRESLYKITGSVAVHFCYPSGVYKKEFLPWLEKEMVVSATTSNPGIATAGTDKLLLPRFVDTSVRTSIEFEGWLAGVGHLIRRARHLSRASHLRSVTSDLVPAA
jgi:peptidoglycan/xylan/chitin deacetylase (PgdA/CDA1 family)